MKNIRVFFFFTDCTTLFFLQIAQIQYHALSESYYVFTSYKNLRRTDWGINGMYVVTNEGIIIINSPWNSSECESFYQHISKKHQKPITHFISTTHDFEGTNMVAFLSLKAVKTYSTRETDRISKVKGINQTDYFIDNMAFSDLEMRF